MSPTINVQHIAVEIGDIVKWTRSVNEIDRLGQAILKVSKETFRNDAITAVRQQSIYDWLCSTGNTALHADERSKRITEFCMSLADDKNHSEILGILETGGIPAYILFKDQLAALERENLHPEVYKHAKGSFQCVQVFPPPGPFQIYPAAYIMTLQVLTQRIELARQEIIVSEF